LQHIQQVFDQLRHHQLFLKLSKCSFAQGKLEYLSHIISAEGVSTDPTKTANMLHWPVPTNVTELIGFLGLTGYYRRFVKNYGIIAKPLTQLLAKKQFVWSDAAQTTFLSLKQAMTTTPILGLSDFTAPFVVETDACDSGIGTVLL